MKKIVLTLIISFLTFFANAQVAKPTKKQTIEYITNTLKDYSSNFESESGLKGGYIIRNINFNNFILTVKYGSVWYDSDNEFTFEYQLNIKEIERISLDSSHKTFYLVFNAFNSKKLIKSQTVDIRPIEKAFDADYKSSLYLPAPNDEKLVQAFNHLRKLCGAPEPIKF